MITVQDVARAVDGIAPFDTQLDWDNSGLLVGDPAGEVDRVLVALDATAEVIREAASLGAQAIVTHHPVIFRGVQRLLAGDPPYEAAARGIAIISAHTCYDMAEGGVNHALADALGLRDRRPLWEERPGELPDAGPESIRRVAVCGGAGSDYLAQAKALGCAAYITGDVRHHEFLAARQLGLLLMDAGHGATEGIAMPRLRRQLEGAMPGVEVVLFSGEGGF